MNRRGKFHFVLALSIPAVAMLAGCTTKSTAQAKAQQAYLAGQNAALRQQLEQQQQASQAPGVTVVGPVQNSQVPWVAGLTLAQAVATANYLGAQAPKEIIITRQGESAKLGADVLLNGVAVPLAPGDVVELR
jgi:outer membrane murein-binding lipoprotein Lpp